MIRVLRVRTADGHPAIFSVDYLPTDIVDLKRDQKPLDGSLYRLLTTQGHPVGHGEAVVAPAVADAKVAKHLGVASGTLLHLKQVDFDAGERPVMLSLEWHVPSVIELRVYRRGPGPLAGPAS